MEKEKDTAKDKAVIDDFTMESVKTSFMKRKEKLVEEARDFNLLSNVFMSVALNDIPACQHVLRIITGIPGLIVKEVRPQYRISKLTAHDAILDILAEDSQGRLINVEIQRKDTIDHARRTRFPEDMSQGDLSARIHFLKCEEGGYQEMCEVSEKIYNEGKLEGKFESKKETAFNMKRKGYSDSVIADILEVGLNVIQQWLSEMSTAGITKM